MRSRSDAKRKIERNLNNLIDFLTHKRCQKSTATYIASKWFWLFIIQFEYSTGIFSFLFFVSSLFDNQNSFQFDPHSHCFMQNNNNAVDSHFLWVFIFIYFFLCQFFPVWEWFNGAHNKQIIWNREKKSRQSLWEKCAIANNETNKLPTQIKQK